MLPITALHATPLPAEAARAFSWHYATRVLDAPALRLLDVVDAAGTAYAREVWLTDGFYALLAAAVVLRVAALPLLHAFVARARQHRT